MGGFPTCGWIPTSGFLPIISFIINKYYLDSEKVINQTFLKVSVIISARNEEANLPSLLNALINQTYSIDLLNLIIVNDRSTDKTADILAGYEKDIPNLTVITIDKTPLDWSPKKWALNALRCMLKQIKMLRTLLKLTKA